LKLKVLFGILISALFIFLTFRQVEFHNMLESLKDANYLWLLPAFFVMLLSHWFRSMRWRYLMEPIKPMKTMPLFSALMIGYAVNNVFPLRLGEFFRAYAIAKSQNVSKSSSFATVIVERFILDLMALLIILVITILFYPFKLPYYDLIRLGGYAILAMTLALIVLIVFLIQKTDMTLNFLRSVLPHKIYVKVEPTFISFMKGCLVFKKSEHYFSILVLTVFIWVLYILSVYFIFSVFNFIVLYHLTIWSSVVILVVVTFSIMLPSSPGALGTYHFLCTEVLKYFTVPSDQAVSFAVISHAMNILPFTILGFVYFLRMNLKFSDAASEEEFLDAEDASQPFPSTVEP